MRHLGKSFKYYVEVNLDEEKSLHHLFEESLSPRDLCAQLALYYKTPIVPEQTLLFFDEIQSCPSALARLRYFYEKYPELHLAAAGSLLEFAVEEIPSFGVGRIRSLFMYPFSFDEFLRALGEGMLADACREASPEHPLMEAIHLRLVSRLKLFLVIGGMPEAVAEYVRTGDLLHSTQVLTDLLVSFQDDFAKYKTKIPVLLIREVFESAVDQAEGKFVYERAAGGEGVVQVKKALELLEMAGLLYPVFHSAANGIPLGAEINRKYRRMLFCDTGLFLHILGNASAVLVAEDFNAVNRGALAEIFAGLEMIKAASCYERPALYCWHREKKQSSAQVDYIIQRGRNIIPVEIKSGSRGSMQSLRLFMKEKNIPRGIRSSLENFTRYDDIDVYPLYAVSNLMRPVQDKH
jgi:predicted AAA+ superfamily ATPase